MSKKKRHFTKGPQVIEKVVEIHKTPTLQEAWDVVSDHMKTIYKTENGIGCLFIDWSNQYGHGWYTPILHNAHGKIYAVATEKWGDIGEL
ncbi:hypothetical protein [Bacillus cereus]|uniref:hypothetical protein n=1 Tax=Bacillus cereus TaxID=1396 RepID=UPI001C0BF13A|nr:hypothetical protein [Bacillus cereus]QWS00672.1 hypothetical protein IMY50_09425 [Bacillus cereus]